MTINYQIKNTVNLSKIDHIAKCLIDSKQAIPSITKLGSVRGRGANDLVPYKEFSRVYNLRRLIFEDAVLLERMIRTVDKDIDDYIISKEFKKGHEPKQWVILMYK